MKKHYFNSQREMRRSFEREKIKTEKYFQSKVKKQFENMVIIPPNESFKKIQSDLINMGWIFDEGLLNYVEFSDYSETLTDSPALRLVNEKFNITLIPHGEGIEISRLEVWEEYQGQGYASLFLDNLLRFLINKGIIDIYVLPQHAGIGKSTQSLAYNTNALQKFYQKRGFQRMESGHYWKLMSTNTIDINNFSPDILTKNLSERRLSNQLS